MLKINKNYVPLEADEQMAVIKWAYMHPICKHYLIANANGGSRHKAEAYRLKLQGVKRGVPDLLLAYPKGGYCGLWIELKRKRNYKIYAEQIAFLKKMNAIGYLGAIAYGADEAIKIIKSYLADEIKGMPSQKTLYYRDIMGFVDEI